MTNSKKYGYSIKKVKTFDDKRGTLFEALRFKTENIPGKDKFMFIQLNQEREEATTIIKKRRNGSFAFQEN